MEALSEFDLPFEGTTCRCWEGGQGLPIIFMHGSGVGAQTSSNFKRVLGPLARRYRVLATDLIGYGQSGYRANGEPFDLQMWQRQLRALMDYAGSGPVVLVGHSLSGSIVLREAAINPRVAGVVTTAAFGVSYGCPINSGWSLPVTREALWNSAYGTVHDRALIDEAEINLRWETISRPGYREYFERMFTQGRQHYVDLAALSDEEFARITCPVLLMHGANDSSFGPEKTSLPMARKIAKADVFILNNCGHSVALEHPDKFMGAIDIYFAAGAG